MKYRRDFVTNSSSASFVIARKPGLSERQLNALAELVEREFLGEVILEPDASEEELQTTAEREYWEEEDLQEIREVLAEGMAVYSGCVSYNGADWKLGNLYEKVWRVLQDTADDDHEFTIIDGDLSY